jgi:glycosyltransferase involved in cell wall biosynthesis
MSLKRIAYVLNVFPKLSETFIAGELAELLKRGIEIHALSLRKPNDEPHHPIVGRAGLMTHMHYDIARFKALLREFQPQLIHAHFAKEATAMARKLADELGVPFTFTAHRYDIYDKAPLDFAARAAAAAAMITVSKANARYISTTFGVPPEHIRIIPCGIDTDYFAPPSPPASEDRPLILCVARLHPAKNQDMLLRACARLKASNIDFRCILVGDGPTRQALLDSRAARDLETSVELVGAADQSEVLRWLERATVVALPSHSEGMPVSLMEAAACGIPAVATAVSGVPELIEDGVTGFVVPPNDDVALAVALARVLSDKDLAARMGTAARRRAVERFSIGLQVDRLLDVWTHATRQECASCL